MENGHQYVGDVLKENYRIPKYQRGYRWTVENVQKLLNDVYEGRLYQGNLTKVKPGNAYNVFSSITFCEGEEQYILDTPKEPYCIQPLVTMYCEKEERYDVIDGQQRLTTIAIIRAALKKVFALEYIKAPNISYESRKESGEYLAAFYEENGTEEYEKNIDFSYMQQAYEEAVKFYTMYLLETEDEQIQKLYGEYLDNVLCNNTRFIWYQVNGTDPQKVFANFNTGKIELTNAELIKALFMNPENYSEKNEKEKRNIKDKQIVISEKWDEIENQLRNPDFWAFIPHPNQYKKEEKECKTRIDMLFDFLVMDKWMEKRQAQNPRENLGDNIENYLNERDKKTSDKYIFDEMELWIKEKMEEGEKEGKTKEQVMSECWREIGKIFSNLKELYENNEMYHCVGLYINLKNRVEERVDQYIENDKRTYLKIYGNIREIIKRPRNERLQIIKEKIKEEIFGRNEISTWIKGRRYNEGEKSDVVKLLLLYNIAVLSTSKATGERFNYLENARNKWEREHIFAQNVQDDLTEEERKAVLTILSGDVYLEYIKYIFSIEQAFEFTYENQKYQFDINHMEEEIAKKLMAANLGYDGNGKNELLARAIKTKQEAEELLAFKEKREEIRRILENEDGEYKDTLIRHYIDNFGDAFSNYKNIDIKDCEDIMQNIYYAKIDENAQKISIWIAEAEFFFEDSLEQFFREKMQNTDKNEIQNKWHEWLYEQTDDETNCKKILEKIRMKYQAELEKKEYAKREFWIKALELHKKRLEIYENEFFEEELSKLLGDNSMGNMTLLTGNKGDNSREIDKESASQNQNVSNKTYKKKKEEVYDFYKKGQFVPLGTLFVFTDLYTKGMNAASLWLPDSRFAYLKDMIQTIEEFLAAV